MNDYLRIKKGPSHDGWSNRLEPADTLHFHQNSVSWLGKRLSAPFDGPTVVVTHHAPMLASIPAEFRENLISAAFASNLAHLVEQSDWWIHGHTHNSVNCQVGTATVISNPRGYVGHEINPQFQHDLVVEI